MTVRSVGRHPGRRLTTAIVAVCLMAPPSAGHPDVLGTVKGLVPGLGFSVSGKPGPYLSQISKRKIEPMKPGVDGAFGFGGDSRGEFQSARISMPLTEKKLEEMLVEIDKHWPYAKPPKVGVHILADGKYGPYALPDGSIAVPIGFLDQAQSDDEVAFVLGHEYAHLAIAHFGRNDRMRMQRKIVTTMAQIYSVCVALSEVRAQKVGDETKFTLADAKRVQAARDRAVEDKKSLDWVLNNLIEPAWQRRQEDEADALGFDMARQMGYAADDAAGPAFQKITSDDTSRFNLVSGLQVRIKDAFSEAMARYGKEAADTGNTSNLMDSFGKGALSGLKSLTLRGIESFLSAKHRPPAERQKGLGDYSSAAYPGVAPLVELKTTWLDQTRSTREFKDAKTAVNALQLAKSAIAAKDPTPANIAAAEKQIRIALATPYGKLPLFTTEAGRIYVLKKDFKTAEALFTLADAHCEKTCDQTLAGFQEHVTMAMDRKDYNRALQVIALYKSRSKTDRDFLPELIRISLKQNKTDQALSYLDQCQATGAPALIDRCAMMAYGPDDVEWASLPVGVQEKLAAATAKAAAQQSMFSGLGDIFKNWDRSSEKE